MGKIFPQIDLDVQNLTAMKKFEVVMSVALFRDRLAKSRLHPNDIKWMPSWLLEFAKNRPSSDGLISFTESDVLKFLQNLRDAKVPCWQRLQAARSLEWYLAGTCILSIDFARSKAFTCPWS